MTAYERVRALWRRPAQALLDRRHRRDDRARVRAARLVLTNSAYTRRRVRAVYGRDAAVCYLGVAADRFDWQPGTDMQAPAGGLRLLSVGALEAHKGFDFVVRALGRLPPVRRPALTIVGASGHPRMPTYLAGLAAAADVRLELRHRVSDAELATLYASSALFVFGARHEPFGLVLLEAMAAGLPVVAVAEGGVPEVVRDGATGLLTPRDEAAFAAAIARLLADEPLRRRLGEAGRAAARRDWTWMAAADRLEQHLS